jgi:hypothetical protein
MTKSTRAPNHKTSVYKRNGENIINVIPLVNRPIVPKGHKRPRKPVPAVLNTVANDPQVSPTPQVAENGRTRSSKELAKTNPITPSHTYPKIAGQYRGNIVNPLAKRTTLSLSINQTQGNLTGTITTGPELPGSGSLTGTIDTAGNLQFTVYNAQPNESLSFSGTVQPDRSLSGTYCSVNEQNRCDPNAGKGTWSATRSAS